MTSSSWPQDWEISIQLNLERAHSFVYTVVGTGIENTCFGCQHLPLRHILDLCLFATTMLSLYHVRERQRLWTHVLLTGPIHLAVRVVTQISASLQFLPTELDLLESGLSVHINFAQWHLVFGTQASTLPGFLATGASEVKWSEVEWSYGEVLGDKRTLYIIVTFCWGYLIVLWLFHLVCILYCGCFVL
jgi:hypothetical protein